MITLYSNTKNCTEWNPESLNGPELKFNNIYMGVIVAMGLVNNDYKSDCRTNSRKLGLYEIQSDTDPNGGGACV